MKRNLGGDKASENRNKILRWVGVNELYIFNITSCRSSDG